MDKHSIMYENLYTVYDGVQKEIIGKQHWNKCSKFCCARSHKLCEISILEGGKKGGKAKERKSKESAVL